MDARGMASNDLEKLPLLAGQTRSSEQSGPEPSLSELQHNAQKAQRAYFKAWSRTTSGKAHDVIMATVTGLLLLFLFLGFTLIAVDSFSDDQDPPIDRHHHESFAKRVPLEVHIMSKCPDAKDCLHDLILPTMANISDKVDFRLSYIGSITDDDDGVACKHGSEECLGDMIELCAAKEYPDPRIFLGFTWCLTRNYEDIPKRDLVEDCALEHGISIQKLNDCTAQKDGVEGLEMLKQSFNRSSNAGVIKSCTVRLDEKTRCIRDDGQWSDCEGGSSPEHLVKDVLRLYRQKNAKQNGWFA